MVTQNIVSLTIGLWWTKSLKILLLEAKGNSDFFLFQRMKGMGGLLLALTVWINKFCSKWQFFCWSAGVDRLHSGSWLRQIFFKDQKVSPGLNWFYPFKEPRVLSFSPQTRLGPCLPPGSVNTDACTCLFWRLCSLEHSSHPPVLAYWLNLANRTLAKRGGHGCATRLSSFPVSYVFFTRVFRDYGHSHSPWIYKLVNPGSLEAEEEEFFKYKSWSTVYKFIKNKSLLKSIKWFPDSSKCYS